MQLTATQFEKIASSAFLVTGGAGFIGSHIAEFLLNAGARKVRVLDNLSTGHFRNLAPFANHHAFQFVKGDIRDVATCKAACMGMDYVFHQAALESVYAPMERPETINEVNVTGFLNMLVAANDAGVKRFVYAPAFPNELYAGVFANIYGMETIGLRYFNVYGQRQDPRRGYAAVIPKCMMQLMRHESPVIDGIDGATRNFIYVEDVVQANILAVLTTDAGAVNQVYDIAVEESISSYQLAWCLKEFLSVFDQSIGDIEIIRGFELEDHDELSQHAGANAEKAQQLLGFQPRYSLRNGLLKSISWYWTYLPQFELEEKEKILHSIFPITLSA